MASNGRFALNIQRITKQIHPFRDLLGIARDICLEQGIDDDFESESVHIGVKYARFAIFPGGDHRIGKGVADAGRV